MRLTLTLLALAAMAVQPVLAQTKTKTTPAAAALSALDMCEVFARGGETLVEDAGDAGWDAYEQDSESPFVRSYDASRDLAGIGWGELFSLVETYPDRVFGYCRIDFAEVEGDGKAVIDALAGLDRYAGDVVEQDGGYYASLVGGSSLLLTHWDDFGFVIQLTTLNPLDGE